ncbi:MAG: hypothetical protein DYG98_01615 [Haliscomenobacteraceae bacterium CHB4]|nr:hypothetical protein [Haliscomenobacteraceae bacterium CHB4]
MYEHFVPLLCILANSRFELSLARTHNDGTEYFFQGNIVKNVLYLYCYKIRSDSCSVNLCT